MIKLTCSYCTATAKYVKIDSTELKVMSFYCSKHYKQVRTEGGYFIAKNADQDYADDRFYVPDNNTVIERGR